MKKICCFLLALNLQISALFADLNPYVLATHPKGGTNLLFKVLNMIHDYRPPSLFCHYDGLHFHPHMIEMCWEEGGMPCVHLFCPAFTYQYFNAHHPDFRVIVIIRDIRDAYVSYAHWICQDPDLSEEEKIDQAFEDQAYFDMSRSLSLFLDHPRFYVIRFEDLVGPKGGGNKEKQTQAIYDLATYVGVPITELLASQYGEELFGDSGGTFRRGQIGSWKKTFNEKQKHWFKRHFGDELILLEYEKDFEW